MGPIAIQGVQGAYSELAARKFFGRSPVSLAYCASFQELFQKVSRKTARYGVVPMENSLAGSIHENYDHFFKYPVHIVGEHYLHVSHNLLTVPGTKLADLRRVYSHPQALAQCAWYLKTLKKVEIVPHFDTAGAAAKVAADGDRSQAAIAGEFAGKVHGLKSLAKAIQNQAENYTRFAIITAGNPGPRVKPKARSPYKTSMMCVLHDIPGALHKALTVFALRDIDLLKIESRPLPGSPFSHLFYLEVSGHEDEKSLHHALRHLEELSQTIKILGSFPADRHFSRARQPISSTR